jgi:hypothetical protein
MKPFHMHFNWPYKSPPRKHIETQILNFLYKVFNARQFFKKMIENIYFKKNAKVCFIIGTLDHMFQSINIVPRQVQH